MEPSVLHLDDILAAQRKEGNAYVEHLRVPALSMGTYRLPAGARDPQEPHAEDELYVVLHGRAAFRLGGEVRDVGPGSVLYVPARAAHRFEDIREDLEVLVVFAPAETPRPESA